MMRRRFMAAAGLLAILWAGEHGVAGAEAVALRPPPVTSELGYLRVTAPEISLPPEVSRVFIIPQTRLPLLAENAQEFQLLFPRDAGALVCRISRQARYQVLMNFDPARREVLFRGAVQAETMPWVLRQGEELAIRHEVRAGRWLAVLVREGREMLLALPVDYPGTAFSRESAFAQLAARQAEQGLAWSDGAWLPVAEVEAREAVRVAAERRRETRQVALRTAAEQGLVVLRDGRILHGRLCGSDRERILFESGGREYWLGIEEVVELPVARILAIGAVDQAKELLARAVRIQDSDLGLASRWAREAEGLVAGVDGAVAPEELAAAVAVRLRVQRLLGEVEAALLSSGRVLHRSTALPREEVAWHLAQGHKLFQRRLWLRSDQLCATCRSSGHLACPQCGARGRIQRPCPVCAGVGQLTCPICVGVGSQDCAVCRGQGSLARLCRRCLGRGTVTSSRGGYPGWGGGPQIIVGGGSIITLPGNRFGYGYGYGYGNPVIVDCARCGGEGRERYSCPTCHGRGARSCPKTVSCQACQAQGFTWVVCPQCQGGKEIACSRCLGCGYLGEPQRFPASPAPVAVPMAPVDEVPAGVGTPAALVPEQSRLIKPAGCELRRREYPI